MEWGSTDQLCESDLAGDLLREAREELNRADMKASILLGIAGVVYGMIASAIIAGDWAPAHVALVPTVVWWLGAAIVGTGVTCLAWTVRPNIDHPMERENLAYFGHAADFDSFEEFKAAVVVREQTLGGSTARERTVDQAWVVSRIAVRKYERLRRAMSMLGIGTLLLAGAMVADWAI